MHCKHLFYGIDHCNEQESRNSPFFVCTPKTMAKHASLTSKCHMRMIQIRDSQKQILISKRGNATAIKPFSTLFDSPAAFPCNDQYSLIAQASLIISSQHASNQPYRFKGPTLH
jgi:hypothetical protein